MALAGLSLMGMVATTGMAKAEDVTVTATVASGIRSITSAPAASLSTTAGVISGALAVTVTETAASGTDPWSVTAKLKEASLSDGLGNSIAAGNMAVADRAVTKVDGGGTTAAPSGSAALNVAQTLFSNSGQVAANAYTGTYASTSTLKLTVPNGTPTGVYTGTLVVTLVQ